MAERPQRPGIWQQLIGISRSLVNLGRIIEGKHLYSASNDALPPELQMPLMLPAPPEHVENSQLLTQHTPGWQIPQPSHLPEPTYAPSMTAFGIVFIALGAVTRWPLSVVGAAIFFLAIRKWIGELLHG